MSLIANDAELNGRQLYQTNQFFRSFANVMEHPEFKEFFNTYMRDVDDIKLVISLMKAYQSLENEIKQDSTPYERISILNSMLRDSTMRQKFIEQIQMLTNMKGDSIGNELPRLH